MNRLLPWCVGVATFLILLVACLWEYYPPLAGPQRLAVTFPASLPVGTHEPLIATGAPGAADFLVVRYLGPRTIILAYDSWGHGGPASAPLTLPPGPRHTLDVQLPSLAAIPGTAHHPSARLHVVFNGTSVLDAPVAPYHTRRATHAHFARNPYGGTSASPQFSGELSRADGRALAGNVRTYFTRTERFGHWLWFGRWQLLASLLLATAAAWATHRLRVSPSPLLPVSPSLGLSALRPHRPFLLTAALCTVAFAAMLTSGTFRLLYPETFGNFYDYQALSLLQGRLDVPEGSLQGEAFIYDGKVYGYFGLTPALLRLPFVIFGLAFGELSRVAMVLAYAATLVGAYLVFQDAARLFCASRPPSASASSPHPAPWATILFTVHVGLGSTVFFLGSRAYIYHEAILWGICFAVFSCWCSLRHLAEPARRWWLGALALGVLSVHARPPTGLFALTVLGSVAATHLLRAWLTPKIINHKSKIINYVRPLLIGTLSVLGVASFNALSYAKFRTFEGCPLRLNVQYSPERLAKIDSRQFHLANLPYGLSSYFVSSTIEVTPRFPWLYLGPFLPVEKFPAAKMDLPDRTAALPYGMTGLFALATLACAWACVRHPAARAPVFVLWASFVPVTLALSAAIATAERYTGDFVPFLICAAAFGLATPVWRPWLTTLLVAATLWACALTFAMTLHYQGAMVWGVPDEVKHNYQQLRARVDGFFLGPRPAAP